jgi:predicted nucleotidyltransferase
LIISGSLFGAAARGDYKRGSDIDMFIVSLDNKYDTVIKMLNDFSIEIRDVLNIPLDLHVNALSALTKGNTYYDPSFVSHLVTDCPQSVKVGEPLEKIIVTNWSAKDAVSARMRSAKLDLARLQA